MSPTRQTADAVDVNQAAELTGLSKKALRRRLERGTLDSIKVGGRRMIPISELSSRGLLDTGEDVGGTAAEEDASRAPATEARQDGTGSPSPAPTPAPAVESESGPGLRTAEPAVDHEPEAGPAAEPQAPAEAPPVEPPPAAEPVTSPMPSVESPRTDEPTAPEPAHARVTPAPSPPSAEPAAAAGPVAQEPPAMPPQPSDAPTSPSAQAEPSAATPPTPSTPMPPTPSAAARATPSTVAPVAPPPAPGIPPIDSTGAAATAPSAAQPQPYPASPQPVAPAPQAGATGASGPPADAYYASPEGFYPARGAWYYWYDYPALRWLAALLAVGLVALLVWLLVIRPDGGDGTTPVQPGAGPAAATQEDLVTLSQELRQPVYWAGELPSTRLELTQSTESWAYVRYLTDDAPVGDPSPDFLTVGTYPTINAFGNLRSYAGREDARTTRIDDGGLAMTVPGSPTSVYFAYPHQDVQVEVYDPDPGRALNLVKTGVIRPVTAGTQTIP